MKKQIVLRFIVEVVNKSILKELDSVCLGFGFQPVMPEAAKGIRRDKKKK